MVGLGDHNVTTLQLWTRLSYTLLAKLFGTYTVAELELHGRLELDPNALEPMSVRLDESSMCVNAEQLRNTFDPRMIKDDGRVTVDRLSQPRNAFLPISVKVVDRVMDDRARQSLKGSSRISTMLEWNTTEVNPTQPSKAESGTLVKLGSVDNSIAPLQHIPLCEDPRSHPVVCEFTAVNERSSSSSSISNRGGISIGQVRRSVLGFFRLNLEQFARTLERYCVYCTTTTAP